MQQFYLVSLFDVVQYMSDIFVGQVIGLPFAFLYVLLLCAAGSHIHAQAFAHHVRAEEVFMTQPCNCINANDVVACCSQGQA